MYLFGKPYSSSDLALIKADLSGMNVVDNGWRSFRSESLYKADNEQAEHYEALRWYLTGVIENLPRHISRVLVIDDGGLLIDLVRSLTSGHLPKGATPAQESA